MIAFEIFMLNKMCIVMVLIDNDSGGTTTPGRAEPRESTKGPGSFLGVQTKHTGSMKSLLGPIPYDKGLT
jgi:hypothetical protein